jgi:hypothetical protein
MAGLLSAENEDFSDRSSIQITVERKSNHVAKFSLIGRGRRLQMTRDNTARDFCSFSQLRSALQKPAINRPFERRHRA